ncbi:MAG TPA: hypothetical protein VD757_01295 [Candidatus Nitrosocosmicus sp.]|nr:hypothetical protein [Candidatus Nitrosocosmicus sp.]
MKYAKYVLSIIAILYIISILTGYPNLNTKAIRIDKITKENLNDVDKIRIFYGIPGQDGVTIEDKKGIDQFMSLLRKYLIVEDKEANIIAGYRHAAHLYIKGKLVMNIVFNDPININGLSYKVIRGKLSSEKIEKIIKSYKE